MNHSLICDAFSSKLSVTGRIRNQPVSRSVMWSANRVVTGRPGYLPMQIGQHSERMEFCIVIVCEVSVFGLGWFISVCDVRDFAAATS
jgi:hypothetical protein